MTSNLPPPIPNIFPDPVRTNENASYQSTGSSVQYELDSDTDRFSFQGFVTVRVPQGVPLPGDIPLMPVRIEMQMWLEEDGEVFVTIPGPIYNVTATLGLEGPIMAKTEFSKPISFDRLVRNLTVGYRILSVTDINGNNAAPLDENGNIIADLMLNVQWQSYDCCCPCE